MNINWILHHTPASLPLVRHVAVAEIDVTHKWEKLFHIGGTYIFILKGVNCLRVVLIVLLTFVSLVAHSQFDELMHRPYNKKLKEIHEFYYHLTLDRPDSARSYMVIDQLRQAAKRAGDTESWLEADLAEALFDYKCLPSASLRKMHGMIETGKTYRVPHITCRAMYVIARSHWDDQRYEQAFRWYSSLDSILQKVSSEDFPNKIEYLQDIGDAHYRFGDYEKAIAYFQESTRQLMHPFFENAWKHAMNNMGLAYQKLNNLELSDSCFRQVLNHNKVNVEIWKGIATGNLGYNQYLRGHEQAAVPLLQQDIDIAVKYGDYALAAGSATPMADILTRRGSLASAKAYIDSTYLYIYRSGQTDRLRLLFPVMSKWYAASGNPGMAARYMDSTMAATERYHEKFSALRMLRATQERMASQREADMQRLRLEGQSQINRRNLILGGLIFCLLSGGFWVFKQRKANEIALKDRDLRLFETSRELQDARIQLQAFARAVSEKDQAVRATDSRDVIEQLNRQVVLTDEGWNKFSELFGKLHPGFQYQLKEQFPTLTPSEIRCLAMEKLHFSNKEMAALQGISTNSVMVTKHRIRKKMGVLSHTEVTALITGI